MQPDDKETLLFTVHCAVERDGKSIVEGFFLPSNKHASLYFPRGTDISRLEEGTLIKADLGAEKQIHRYARQHRYTEIKIPAENLVILNYPDIILKIKDCPVYLPPEVSVDQLYDVTGTIWQPDGPNHLNDVTLKVSKASLAHMAFDEEASSRAIDPWIIYPRPKGSWDERPQLVSISNDDVMTFRSVEMADDGKTGLVHGIVTATIFDAEASVLEAKNHHPGRISSHQGSGPGIDLRVRFNDGPYKDAVKPIQIRLAFNIAAPNAGDTVKIQEIQKDRVGDMDGCIGATHKQITDETWRLMREMRQGPA